jgi:hypothetical protein
MQAKPFPLSIATGLSFCNRTKERSKLQKNILAGHHLWLEAHRRHGKSSLLLQVQDDFKEEEQRVAMRRIDLAFTMEKTDIINMLCNGALDLISELIKSTNEGDEVSFFKAIQNRMQQYFVTFNPSMQIDRGMPTARFHAPPSLEMLKRTLLTMDKMAGEHNYRVVFVIDEFQQIGKSGKSKKKQVDHSIEGAIRHCLELSQYTNYIFCGSEVTLMKEAMEAENRPLYNHTVKIPIGRISKECYLTHIGELWKSRWDAPIANDVFDSIIQLTQRHPYYVNALCAQLWLDDAMPTQEIVEQKWIELVELERSVLRDKVLNLTKNELSIIKALGTEPTSEPTSWAFTQRVTIPIGSINSTLEQVIDKGLVYVKDGTYFVINPALAYLATH